jgi:hypothetical protein
MIVYYKFTAVLKHTLNLQYDTYRICIGLLGSLNSNTVIFH